jgi:hypothetical protein
MSKAQTQVSALEAAEKIMTAQMTAPTIDAVIDQGKKELEAERQSIDGNLNARRKQLAGPIGSFVHPEWFEKKKTTTPGFTGTPKTADEFLKKHAS